MQSMGSMNLPTTGKRLDPEGTNTQTVNDIASQERAAKSQRQIPALNVVDVPPAPVRQPIAPAGSVIPAFPGPYNPFIVSRYYAGTLPGGENANMNPEQEWPVLGPNEAYYLRRNAAGQMTPYSRTVAPSPMQVTLGQTKAEIADVVESVLPELTAKQRQRLTARWRNINQHVKGKHRGNDKTPTMAQMEKVRMLAMELANKATAARAYASARSAMKNRHSLQQKRKTIALSDGTTVGYNRRYEKKLESNAIKQAAYATGKTAAAAKRRELTAANKANRVAIARAHDRKVNPKDRT